jgi:hypothetical protein
LSDDPDRPQLRARALSVPAQGLIVLVLVLAIGAGIWVARSRINGEARDAEVAESNQSRRQDGLFYPTQAQWATLTVEPVQQ